MLKNNRAWTMNLPFRTTRGIISTCTDPFLNLAYEDLLLKHKCVTRPDERLIYIYRNRPCVIIGRFQNAWREANVASLHATQTPLVRRMSGGGTVYHDAGNINCSVFTHPSQHIRKRNLQIVADMLNQHLGTNVHVGMRDELLIGEGEKIKKISGTAARIVRDISYHHFTLLLHASREAMHLHLSPSSLARSMQTNATASQPMPVANLSEFCPVERFSNIDQMLFDAFEAEKVEVVDFNRVEDQELSAELNEAAMNISRWEHIYGRSPKFGVTKPFSGNDDLEYDLRITFVDGLFENIEMIMKASFFDVDTKLAAAASLLSAGLRGCRCDSVDVAKLCDKFSASFADNVLVAMLTQNVDEIVRGICSYES